ncbi:type II toxin-antitoxin system RelE/ParE family toxin [Carboxylicivirga mesophila]|uniref:Type II toxin-antitoxin system RelE/ParE family toxin n=1 Tax=Carboxylicivirga mesophila TaxID=1166478 RepID=A0ABS5K8W2_9BACT|nr:type II toxin-antitoxin system RelE/ParE family toxin [Carboxylicivirga mesophila]MBS2211431.1 type II toxin-antitoxin system RelE/ParE family toxin [Carboxylicivirga mesophila]
MKVKFKTNELEYFYTTPLDEIKGKLPFQKDVIKQFKRKMQILLSIQHLEELNQFKSLNFEFLKGDRKGECSIRLNRTYRLLFIPMNEQHDDLIVEIILINEISKHYQK